MDLAEQNIVFVLGGPGSGKVEQCRRITKEFGHTLINTQEMLQAELRKGSSAGQKIQEAITTGSLVPQEVIIGLLKAKMKRTGSSKFLIDGYPRELSQAFLFEREVAPVKTV